MNLDRVAFEERSIAKRGPGEIRKSFLSFNFDQLSTSTSRDLC